MELTGKNVRFVNEITYGLSDGQEITFKKGDTFFCIHELINHAEKVAVIQAPYRMAVVVVAEDLEVVEDDSTGTNEFEEVR